MKVLVTGVKGQLGHDVLKELTMRNIQAIGADMEDFDITNEAETTQYITKLLPDAVIHCAAYTAVEKAEDEPSVCSAVNVDGTKHIAAACGKTGAKLIYISTDYVFGGKGTELLQIDSPKNPLNVYGKSKLMGEEAAQSGCLRCFIVRTSWVFGKNGGNFVKTMLRLGAEKTSITVVCDQVGSPTYTPDLAVLLCDMVKTEKYGVYHAANEGYCSWAEFAAEIMKQANLPAAAIPVKSEDYPSKAIRPLNSRLSLRSLDEAGFKRLPCWQDALGRFMKELE